MRVVFELLGFVAWTPKSHLRCYHLSASISMIEVHLGTVTNSRQKCLFQNNDSFSMEKKAIYTNDMKAIWNLGTSKTGTVFGNSVY